MALKTEAFLNLLNVKLTCLLTCIYTYLHTYLHVYLLTSIHRSLQLLSSFSLAQIKEFCEQLALRNVLIGLPEGFFCSFQTYDASLSCTLTMIRPCCASNTDVSVQSWVSDKQLSQIKHWQSDNELVKNLQFLLYILVKDIQIFSHVCIYFSQMFNLSFFLLQLSQSYFYVPFFFLSTVSPFYIVGLNQSI